jgi:3-dehydroquinate dehydratase-2
MDYFKRWCLYTYLDCVPIKAITTPVIEVHISNTYSRESFRHQSYISGNAKELSSGLDYKAMSWRSDRFVKNK